MKLNNKISWLMGRVQKSLLPHLDECFDTPPTEQEKRLVAILEIVQVEKFVSNRTTSHWRGRKPLDRQSLACFVHNRNPQSCNQEFPTIAK